MPERLLKEVVHCQNSAALLRTIAAEAEGMRRTRCLEIADQFDRMACEMEEFVRQSDPAGSPRK